MKVNMKRVKSAAAKFGIGTSKNHIHKFWETYECQIRDLHYKKA